MTPGPLSLGCFEDDLPGMWFAGILTIATLAWARAAVVPHRPARAAPAGAPGSTAGTRPPGRAEGGLPVADAGEFEQHRLEQVANLLAVALARVAVDLGLQAFEQENEERI